MDVRNVLCTDIGGTSFDIALITDGRFEITQTPDIARFVLNIPLVQHRLDRRRHRLVRAREPELQPARARPRLGGLADRRVLARGRPRDGVGHRPEPRARPAEPRLLPRRRGRAGRRARPRRGRAPDRAAARASTLDDGGRRRDRAVRAHAQERGRRTDPRQGLLARPTTRCSATAEAGPLHVAGYTEGVSYAEVLVPAWAAGFSAFGCACADFDYRYDQTVDLPLLPSFGDAERAGIGGMITAAWLGLEDRVAGEFEKSGHRPRGHPLHPRGAHAVLRAAERHRVRLTAPAARRTPRTSTS